MASTSAPTPQPATAVAVILQKLEQLRVIAPLPDLDRPTLFISAGKLCMETTSRLVAMMSERKLDYAQRKKAATEALAFAMMADALMEHAATLVAAPAAPSA